MKNITVIGLNYAPEDTAISLYTTQMVKYLSRNYKVDVITGVPYYPDWRINDEYKRKPKFIIEEVGNITVYRYKQYIPNNPTFINRILQLLDFTLGSIFNIFKVKSPDLVICIVPYTSSIVLGLILSKIMKAKVWVHIQDFEFDAAVESGLVSKEKLISTILFKGLFWIEKKLLDSVHIVSTISFSMMRKLQSKTATSRYYLPNWVDKDIINPYRSVRHPYYASKFNVLYSGNIGEKQDWLFFVDLVKRFETNDKIEFVIVGAGAKKDWLVKNTKLFRNVKHYQAVPYHELNNLLCSADLHILFQKSNIIDTVMPSKLLGMMASKKPSIVTGNLDSEVAQILTKSKGGLFFDSGNIGGVVQAVDKLSNEHASAIEMGRDARTYIIDNFSADDILERLTSKVNEVIS